MRPDITARVRANPDFALLEAARGGFSRLLCLAIMVIYFGFIYLVAFRQDIMSLPVGGGITLAFPLGLGVIVLAILITGIYVVRANGQFDRLTARIREETR